MGKLVLFDRPVRPVTETRLREKREGQIVIFTGVRYERNEKPDTGAGTDPAKPNRKRV